MPFKLIIFDLDGTLIDSSIDITNAINYAVQPYGVKPVPVQETISLVGEGITRLIEKLINRTQRTEDRGQDREINKDLLVERFLVHYSAHLVDNTTVYPEVRETFEKLGIYKKAVISNKREALSTKILNDLGLLKYLDLVVGSDTTPEKKPSPVPLFHALSKLDVRSEDAVIVGDSNYDIEAGKAAGIKTIAVTYGYMPVELLKDADYLIDKMSELSNILRLL